MSTVADLLTKIESFCEEAGIAEATLGTRAVNDGKFVQRLRDGAGVTIKTIDRVHAYIDQERAKMDAARAGHTAGKEPPARPTRRARGPGFRKAA